MSMTAEVDDFAGKDSEPHFALFPERGEVRGAEGAIHPMAEELQVLIDRQLSISNFDIELERKILLCYEIVWYQIEVRLKLGALKICKKVLT